MNILHFFCFCIADYVFVCLLLADFYAFYTKMTYFPDKKVFFHFNSANLIIYYARAKNNFIASIIFRNFLRFMLLRVLTVKDYIPYPLGDEIKKFRLAVNLSGKFIFYFIANWNDKITGLWSEFLNCAS